MRLSVRAAGSPSAHGSDPPLSNRARLLWTFGNGCMLLGIVLLLYVGGIYSQSSFARYAARGDTDVPAPRALSTSANAEPAPFVAPILAEANSVERHVAGAIPSAAQADHQSSVTRVVIPSIGVNSKVVEVGWDLKQQDGQPVAVWNVAEYAVGQHRGSANPGEGGNIVLAGHVGGYGKVFKDLFSIQAGDALTLYSDGQQYLYTVQERLLVTEEGVSAEQRALNAHAIDPTDSEMVTLVTCWPATGPERFTQRVIIRAIPFSTAAAASTWAQSSWTAR